MVASKRHLHHWLVRLRPYGVGYFVAAFLVLGVVALFALRQNNLGAVRLRDQLLEVDKQNGDVEAALGKLREYMYSHMNAQLSNDTGIYPPIQLKYTYERLSAAEKQRVQTANQKIYNDAQKTCEALVPNGLSGSGRIPCIQQYVDTKGQKEQSVPDALYKFDFVSPAWSPDLAGFLVVLAFMALILLIARIAAALWLRASLSD
ncbi:MAG TPA: hypothetical protein VK694_08130 [Verrucomicrobiae bacterium]|nr:hypothetical protein [Verrucomicrobiae bacterium]